jgi:hypothetical protein
VTGDLSSLVKVSFFTSFWNTVDVSVQARATAEIATRFSNANARDIAINFCEIDDEISNKGLERSRRRCSKFNPRPRFVIPTSSYPACTVSVKDSSFL